MSLYDLGTGLLDSLEQQAFQHDVELPKRRMVYMSPIPADCEQVAALFNGWSLYPDSGQLVPCIQGLWVAGFSIIITRCTPAIAKSGSKNPTPTVDQMQAAAALASRDAELFRDLAPGLGDLMSPQITVQSPSGGLQTVEFSFQIPG